jgi:hypothetical protein
MSNQIKNLIKRFKNQIDTYKKSDYNEAQTRLDFLNPFFMALGFLVPKFCKAKADDSNNPTV